MALHLTVAQSPPSLLSSPVPSASSHEPLSCWLSRSSSFRGVGTRISRASPRRGVVVTAARSGLDTSAEVVTGQVTEVDKDTFWPLVKAAGSRVVVLDMYTQWCGPCKVMAPKFQQLSEEHLDVVFMKLDCNQENKPLAKELGIKVVPTFKILKDGKVVKEVTGAKFDDLVDTINTVKSTS